MRNLLRNRRGTVAFATVIALVPLIGVMALGGEAATWYVTKQHAQIAADAAAYSGALQRACELGPSCNVTNSVEYRGKQFAAQNAFCNGGDTSYPGSRCAGTLPGGVTHTVQIATLSSWEGIAGNYVQATVSQQQPAYLAAILGLSTVNIGAIGVARVDTLARPCVLALSEPVSFQGSTTVSSPYCGLASNSTASNSIDFTGNGLNVSNVGSISGQGGCVETGGSRCATAVTYASPVPNPLSGLDAPMALLTANGTTFTGTPNGRCAGSSPVAYNSASATTRCYNHALNINSNVTLNGVYFFGGNTRITGSPVISGTATLILLPGATLSITGNPTIQLTALTTIETWQVPTALQSSSVRNLMSGLLIYDPETTNGNQTVNIQGSTTSRFIGTIYAPNATVQYTGSTQSTTCTQVIAKGVKLSGNSNFDNSSCPTTSMASAHIVRMVQ